MTDINFVAVLVFAFCSPANGCDDKVAAYTFDTLSVSEEEVCRASKRKLRLALTNSDTKTLVRRIHHCYVTEAQPFYEKR